MNPKNRPTWVKITLVVIAVLDVAIAVEQFRQYLRQES